MSSGEAAVVVEEKVEDAAEPQPVAASADSAPVKEELKPAAEQAAAPAVPEDAQGVYAELESLVSSWEKLSDDDLLRGQGEAYYGMLASLRDRMLPLHTKYKAEGYMAPAVARWRKLNEEIPGRINALRLARRAKDIHEGTASEIEALENKE